MALPQLWLDMPEQLEGKSVQQVIAFAGDGHLADGSSASTEFRAYLELVEPEAIERYAVECLTARFESGGFALQDVISEIGARLGFGVERGLYRGRAGEIGHDGLWRLPNGHSIVVEVKTTDAYRIDLNTIDTYRRKLIDRGDADSDRSSVLIVVGREDTGDLEAQIRGSRHAWDMRLISVEALISLLSLRVDVDDPRMVDRIGQILVPHEFTKLDEIILFVFATAEDVKAESSSFQSPNLDPVIPAADSQEEVTDTARSGPSGTQLDLQAFRRACIARVPTRLLRRTNTRFISEDGETMAICLVSREYNKSGSPEFWFGFHRHQLDALDSATNGLLVLGCGSPSLTFSIPVNELRPWLEGMNITERSGSFYWHWHIHRSGGKYELWPKAGFQRIDLTGYLVEPD